MLSHFASLDISVIIVNYNGRHWLEGCLNSLKHQVKGLTYEVIVVDNASQDDSVLLLREAFPWVKILVNTENVGFAKANNRAIALAKGRYILLLNTDTVFLHGLDLLVAFLGSHSDCAAVGPRMLNGERRPRGSWGYFPTLPRLMLTMVMVNHLPFFRHHFRPLIVRPDHSEFYCLPRQVEWASGACLLIRREVIEEVGLLDEHYFMYGEDTEWCYRVRQAGYQVWVLSSSEIIHYGAGGEEWRSWKGARATVQAYKSFIYFHRKHSPGWMQVPLRLGLGIGALLRLLGGGILFLREQSDGRKWASQVMSTYLNVLRVILLQGEL